MPRFTFRTIVGSASPRDEGSFELLDEDDARRRARAIFDAEVRAAPDSAVQVEVRDGEGRHVHTVVAL